MATPPQNLLKHSNYEADMKFSTTSLVLHYHFYSGAKLFLVLPKPKRSNMGFGGFYKDLLFAEDVVLLSSREVLKKLSWLQHISSLFQSE